MKNILQNIQSQLAELTEIKYIDEDWGQLDYYSQNMPVQWPCVLIDIASATYSNLGIDRDKSPQNRQMGSYVVQITIANIKLSPSSAKSSSLQKEKAWEVLDLVEQVHCQLHGYSPTPNSSKLIRTSFARQMRDDGVQEYRVNYKLETSNV